MTCKIHGRTCSGEHGSDVPPVRDGISLRSRSHTLTRACCYNLPQGGYGLQLDFAAIRVGVALRPGMSPLEVIDQLRRMCDLIESEFGIEKDAHHTESKSSRWDAAQKTNSEAEKCCDGVCDGACTR